MNKFGIIVFCIINLGLLLALSPYVQAQVSFTQYGSFQVSPGPVVTGDFNGDGELDLVVASRGSDSVSVLLGNGVGSFSAPTNFTVGDGPVALTTRDFNNDGKLDLAVANETFIFPLPPGTVSILLGTGAGSFEAASNFEVGNRPLSVATADFNGDQILDLVTANDFSADVSVLLGTGTGAFTDATSFSVGFRPKFVSIDDLNGDGKLDLAVANGEDGTVSILLGTGTGSFGQAADFAAGKYPMSLSIGDLNGDGKLDLSTANDGTDHVTTLMGDGTGSFAAGTTKLQTTADHFTLRPLTLRSRTDDNSPLGSNQK